MRKIQYWKIYTAILNREKLPRKIKKRILGKRLSKTKIKKLLKTVEVITSCKTMYQQPVIKPFLFCPKCGCKEYIGTGNRTGYPEHWEYFHCLRCWNVVAGIDNSPFVHVLETNEKSFELF